MADKFKFLEHPADIKFQAIGKSLNELFQNATLAVSKYLSNDKKIQNKLKKHIKIRAENPESLLYHFVDEIIFLLDAEKFAISSAKIKIEDNTLEAELFGDNSSNYKIKQIKAATYAEMYIKQLEDKTWQCQMVLDV